MSASVGPKLIGYWAASTEKSFEVGPGWPHPMDLTGEWDPDDRILISKYLCEGTPINRFCGCATCRICDEILGSSDYTDGTWVWPEKLEHYILKHNVRLPNEFIDFARASWKSLFKLSFLKAHLIQKYHMPEDFKYNILNHDFWLDWAAAEIPARPSSEALSFRDAKNLCLKLSHSTWEACIEERFGRWRILCGSQTEKRLMYVEKCNTEHLQRRLLAWRKSDPNDLLCPEKAQSIAEEFDGEWGMIRLIGTRSDLWQIWVNPPGRKWPSESEIKNVPQLARDQDIRYTDGSRTFIQTQLDEFQWRSSLNKIREESIKANSFRKSRNKSN